MPVTFEAGCICCFRVLRDGHPLRPRRSICHMERISGPYKGYYIAAYTVEAGTQFVGYAKVCLDAPDSVWNANTVEKLTSAAGCRSELEAVVAAEQKARQAIAELTSAWDSTTAPGALES
jgi:hypothetical protein